MMVDKNTGQELFKSLYFYYFYFGRKHSSVGLLTHEYFPFMTELRAKKNRHC